MHLPFRHLKHTNSSRDRKVYHCDDHVDCEHYFTIIEGVNSEGIEAYLCGILFSGWFLFFFGGVVFFNFQGGLEF